MLPLHVKQPSPWLRAHPRYACRAPYGADSTVEQLAALALYDEGALAFRPSSSTFSPRDDRIATGPAGGTICTAAPAAPGSPWTATRARRPTRGQWRTT